LSKVKDVLEDEDAMQKIMDQYKKQEETKEEHQKHIISRIEALVKVAGVEYDDYLKALGTSKTGYSIVQQRDLDEININSYNIEWMRAWNGNMDIQVVLD
jgi:ribosomal protein L20